MYAEICLINPLLRVEFGLVANTKPRTSALNSFHLALRGLVFESKTTLCNKR